MTRTPYNEAHIQQYSLIIAVIHLNIFVEFEPEQENAVTKVLWPVLLSGICFLLLPIIKINTPVRKFN